MLEPALIIIALWSAFVNPFFAFLHIFFLLAPTRCVLLYLLRNCKILKFLCT
jgi:hypothetical protein